MKLQGDPAEWAVSQSAFGRIIGVSHQRVNQLIDEEVVIRDESSKSGAVLLIKSLEHYYRSKQRYEDAAGKVDFWAERGLHERAKRQLAELRLKERCGELYEAETVERVITEQLTDFRNKLLGLPSKLAAICEGKSRGEIYDLLNSELEAALEELSLEGNDYESGASTEEGDEGGD